MSHDKVFLPELKNENMPFVLLNMSSVICHNKQNQNFIESEMAFVNIIES